MSAPMHDKSLPEVGQVRLRGQVLLRCSHTRTVPSLHACFSPCVVLQVKVRRRGSDKKFVASVLAVGTECDIGELLGLIMWDLSVQEKCCTQQHSLALLLHASKFSQPTGPSASFSTRQSHLFLIYCCVSVSSQPALQPCSLLKMTVSGRVLSLLCLAVCLSSRMQSQWWATPLVGTP